MSAGEALRRLAVNPVLRKELRIGLRERRIFIIQTIYLVVLAGVAAVILGNAAEVDDFSGLPQQGLTLFGWVVGLQAVMVVLITPALTCGQISSERERNSFELLMASRLTPLEIATGKLLHALGYVGLLLFSSVPVVSLSFLLGGVSVADVLVAYGSLAVAALLAAQLGQLFSARESRTIYATNQTYGTLLLALFGLPFLLGPALFDGTGKLLAYGDLQVPLWAVLLANALCLSVFLLLKALNHLRPRAVLVAGMGALFCAWLWTDCAVAGLTLASMTEQGEGSGAAGWMWTLLVLGTVGAAGLMVNPGRLPAPLEQAAHDRSAFSRWYLWVAVLSLGLGIAGGFHHHSGAAAEQVLGSWGLGTSLVLTLSVGTRALHRRLGGRVSFPVLYFGLLVLVCVMPIMPLAAASEAGPRPAALPLWTGVPVAPWAGILSLWSADWPQVEVPGAGPVPMAAATFGLYALAALAAMAASAAHGRRR